MPPSTISDTAIQTTHHKWVHTPWINLWNDFKCFITLYGGEYKSNTYKLLLQSHVIAFNHMWLITRKTTIFTTVQTVYQTALLWNVLQTLLLSKLTYRLWFNQMLLILKLFYQLMLSKWFIDRYQVNLLLKLYLCFKCFMKTYLCFIYPIACPYMYRCINNV